MKFVSALIALVITGIIYGTPQITFLAFRKSPITLKKLKIVSISLTVFVFFGFELVYVLAYDGSAKASASLIWGIIFYNIIKKQFIKRGMIINADPLKPQNAPSPVGTTMPPYPSSFYMTNKSNSTPPSISELCGSRIVPLFERSCNSIISKVSSSDIAKNVTFETICFVYSMIDYAAFSADASVKDRNTIRDSVIGSSFFREKILADANITDTMINRYELYSQLLSGVNPRGEWMLYQTDTIDLSNPVNRCIVCFGDILVNPDCALDYENAPFAIHDIFKCSEFASSFALNIPSTVLSILEYFHLDKQKTYMGKQ